MKRNQRVATLVLSLFLVAVPGIGSADTTIFSDRKETGGRLDFSKVVQGHSGEDVRHRLTMYKRWGAKHLKDRNNMLIFSFNTDDDDQFERSLHIDADPDGRGLKGEMRDWESDELIGEVLLTRKNRRTVQATIPLDMLGNNVTSYRWRVGSLYHAPDYGPCGMKSDVFQCGDYFPQRGLATHSL